MVLAVPCLLHNVRSCTSTMNHLCYIYYFTLQCFAFSILILISSSQQSIKIFPPPAHQSSGLIIKYDTGRTAGYSTPAQKADKSY